MPYPSREDQAKAEIGVTAIPRALTVALIAAFLLTIASVPLLDVKTSRMPAITGTANLPAQLREIEDTLPKQSNVAQHAAPILQRFITHNLATGNDTVYLGRDGWLFYDPDVRHLTGQGFLPRQPNPVTAILQFHDQLKSRGIELLIIPTPSKPAIHPKMLQPGLERPLENASLPRFKHIMYQQGIHVFDPAPLLAEAAKTGGPQFLSSDTHWRPEAMELTATHLATFVNEQITSLPQSLGVEYRRAEQSIRNRGDLAAILNVDRATDWQTVPLHPIAQYNGQPWSPHDDAEILWLGDSFSNIYSAAEMGWGASAGFAEQFSRSIERPLDALRRNDNGAFATRQTLADELARGNDRLAGKKLVIWQFAARELSFGDWQLIDLRLGTKPARRLLVPSPGETWQITGEIATMGIPPQPGNLAYRDHILAIHLRNIISENPTSIKGNQAVVYLRSMIDGKLTPAAALRPGETIRLKVRDWSQVARQYEFIRRSEIPDAELRTQPPCWGELIEP